MCEAAPVVSGALSDMVGGNGLALTGAVGLELAGSRASGNSAILLRFSWQRQPEGQV